MYVNLIIVMTLRERERERERERCAKPLISIESIGH